MTKSEDQIEIDEVKGDIPGPLQRMSRIQHRCKESLSRNHEKGTEKRLGNLELKSPRTL